MTAIHLHISPDAVRMGRAAGDLAATVIRAGISHTGRARVMLAAAPSQSETLRAIAAADIDFARVEFFHMDDYIGLRPDAPQGFGNWLEANFFSLLPSRPVFHRIDAQSDAEQSARAYDALMGEEPFDVTLCGLGVNGHLAFNDPPADFATERGAFPVRLDDVSRTQQVNEGHFPDVASVPADAISVTIPRLLNAHTVVCSVPGRAKSTAVRETLLRRPDPMYPGTALHTHPDAHLFVDADSYPEAVA